MQEILIFKVSEKRNKDVYIGLGKQNTKEIYIK